MVGVKDMQLWFRISVYIKPSLMYRLSDYYWFNIVRERFHKFRILKIRDENLHFKIFFLLGELFDAIKQRYRGIFETQKSGNKTSSGEIGDDIRRHACPKMGQDQVSGKRPLLACHTSCKYSMETSRN